jgi:hypothetical protein
MAFRGLPPFLPLARAASALAALDTCPPFRPSATACGFLATGQRLQLGFKAGHERLLVGQLGHGEQMRLRPLAVGGSRHDGSLFLSHAHTGAVKGVGHGGDAKCVRHEERITQAIGIVNDKVRAA